MAYGEDEEYCCLHVGDEKQKITLEGWLAGAELETAEVDVEIKQPEKVRMLDCRLIAYLVS